MNERLPAPGTCGAWLLACRPKTLSAALAPVLVGTGVAARCGGIQWLEATAALLVATALQVAANLANDAFDFEKGADDERRLGPVRTAQAGLLSTRALRVGLGLSIALALALGGYLATVTTPWLWLVGVAAIVSAVAYTAGPYPLGYHGLGEAFVLAFFGFVAVVGTTFVQVRALPSLAWWASLPPGLLAAAILVVNNIRDREGDARVGKRTLVVRFGRRVAFAEYMGCLTVAYLVPVGLWAWGATGPWVLLAWLTLPLARGLLVRVHREEGHALNLALAGTAQLMASFGMLFGLGLALG